jgi:hypothetical protein
VGVGVRAAAGGVWGAAGAGEGLPRRGGRGWAVCCGVQGQGAVEVLPRVGGAAGGGSLLHRDEAGVWRGRGVGILSGREWANYLICRGYDTTYPYTELCHHR